MYNSVSSTLASFPKFINKIVSTEVHLPKTTDHATTGGYHSSIIKTNKKVGKHDFLTTKLNRIRQKSRCLGVSHYLLEVSSGE